MHSLSDGVCDVRGCVIIMNTEQSQVQKTHKNNIAWRKIFLIAFISPLLLFFVAMLLLSTATGRKVFDFLCELGAIIFNYDYLTMVQYHCPSPAAGTLLILVGTPLAGFSLGAVITKNKRFLHGILAGFFSGILTFVLLFLWVVLWYLEIH